MIRVKEVVSVMRYAAIDRKPLGDLVVYMNAASRTYIQLRAPPYDFLANNISILLCAGL